MQKTTRDNRLGGADTTSMNATQRHQILARYREHAVRFETTAASRRPATGEVVPIFPRPAEPLQSPTVRELEVLQLISEGFTNYEIAKRLFVVEETVKTHVRRILAKLQAVSRAHAVAVGFRSGLVT